MTGGPVPGQFQEEQHQEDEQELEHIIEEQGGFPSQNEDDQDGHDLEDGPAASQLSGCIRTGL